MTGLSSVLAHSDGWTLGRSPRSGLGHQSGQFLVQWCSKVTRSARGHRSRKWAIVEKIIQKIRTCCSHVRPHQAPVCWTHNYSCHHNGLRILPPRHIQRDLFRRKPFAWGKVFSEFELRESKCHADSHLPPWTSCAFLKNKSKLAFFKF